MSSFQSSFTRGRHLCLRHNYTLPRPTISSSSSSLLSLHSLTRTSSIRPLSISTNLLTTLRTSRIPTQGRIRLPVIAPSPPLSSPTNFSSHRDYTQSSSSGKPQADLLVEELQELYETAKDEFEIATESTDGATIYAASDRESARDALDELLAVFALYTTEFGEGTSTGTGNGEEAEAEAAAATVEEGDGQEKGQGEERKIFREVSTNFNPAEIAPEVREEVRRRVGHRLRELQNAVEALEERAHAE